MRNQPLATFALLFAGALAVAGAQQPAKVDVSQIGPKVGTAAPPFSGTDQHGAPQSLKSAAGPKGTMVVFFRSADW